MKPNVEIPTGYRRRNGFVLMTMALVAVAMLGALGLAVDMGRIFIIRNETQAFCDAAALAAASYLDNTSDGLQNGDAAAKATAVKWNFSTTTVPSPTVEYATSPSGPWSDKTNFPANGADSGAGCSTGKSSTNDPACGYKFVRVKTSVQVPLYFLPVVETAVTKTYNQTVNSQAIAGQVDITGSPESPYTGVSEGCYTITTPINAVGQGCPNSAPSVGPPNFGLSIGNDTTPCINGTTNGNNAAVGCYDIQWPKFNSGGGGNGKTCAATQQDADNCFLAQSPPCANDQGGTNAEISVVANWGSSTNGYWGLQAASSISAEVLAYVPNPNMPVVGAGTNIQPVLTSGQQQSQANTLDDRVNQDPANWETTYSAYLADSTHNGRRLMIAPVVYPSSSTSTVVQGFGLYFLLSNATAAGTTSDYYKKQTDGNKPYCAMYVGTSCVGCKDNGVGGNTGAAAVKLIQ
ncbi:MAG TPA: pilus assembly protein TadG-related protein [Bryobacteraceae bacterium]|nr:pilus assembly protein TadG-related protein [Bryobacteraceae bacterium]